MQNDEQIVYAGFFVRLFAYFIDSFILGAGLLIVKIPVFICRVVVEDFPLTRQVFFSFSAWDIILYVIGVAYFVLLTYFTGRTLGKRLLRIRVVSSEEKLTLWSVIYRETIGRYLCTLAIWIGYIVIGVDSQKRGFHDMLADTRVIYDL